MLDKIKTWLNPLTWIEQFLFKELRDKGVKHAVTAITGLLGSVFFVQKIQPLLEKAGMTIDQNTLTVAITGFCAGIAGWIINFVERVTGQPITDETQK